MDCTIARWRSINLSARQFSTEGLAATVVAAVERTVIEPTALHLEIPPKAC
jgi:EAL domain-containing protein (putative c-di-GMP-specific phosphodiesterase class I)